MGTFCENGFENYFEENNINHIAYIWKKQYMEGIDRNDIKPGFIKIALGDDKISDVREKALRSAIRTSKSTGLPIQCHAVSSKVVLEATKILKEEDLKFSKFIWAHVDNDMNIDVITEFIPLCNIYGIYYDVFKQMLVLNTMSCLDF